LIGVAINAGVNFDPGDGAKDAVFAIVREGLPKSAQLLDKVVYIPLGEPRFNFNGNSDIAIHGKNVNLHLRPWALRLHPASRFLDVNAPSLKEPNDGRFYQVFDKLTPASG
jgi:hypothetical protein